MGLRACTVDAVANAAAVGILTAVIAVVNDS